MTISGAGLGGVFRVGFGSAASLIGLTVTGGSSFSSGGGLANYGTVTLTDCTVSDNSGTDGGGVFNSGTATLIDCTISGNSAYLGGGVYSYGTLTLTACTISGNSALYHGGVSVDGRARSRS